jgi:hypothetical protein
VADALSVPKNYLMLIAGLVWCFAGAMVCMVGLPLLARLGVVTPLLYALAAAVFGVFYLFVFGRLVAKHTARVRAVEQARRPFWEFFDKGSYIVMAIMMSGGMALRLSHLIPDAGIAFFYSGLGVALFACGTRFLSVFARRLVLAPAA